MQESKGKWVWYLGGEDPWGRARATHSNILALRIPWAGEPAGLQSMGSQRVGHDRSELAHMAHMGKNNKVYRIMLLIDFIDAFKIIL